MFGFFRLIKITLLHAAAENENSDIVYNIGLYGYRRVCLVIRHLRGSDFKLNFIYERVC